MPAAHCTILPPQHTTTTRTYTHPHTTTTTTNVQSRNHYHHQCTKQKGALKQMWCGLRGPLNDPGEDTLKRAHFSVQQMRTELKEKNKLAGTGKAAEAIVLASRILCCVPPPLPVPRDAGRAAPTRSRGCCERQPRQAVHCRCFLGPRPHRVPHHHSLAKRHAASNCLNRAPAKRHTAAVGVCRDLAKCHTTAASPSATLPLPF